MIVNSFKNLTALPVLLSLFLFSTKNSIGQNNQVPTTLNIQGVLNNANGQPVANGTYTISFRIYESTLGDVTEWSEVQNNIVVQSGIFNAILGKISPLNIPFDRPYFLGIKVGQEPEMEPRIELTSTPYSLIAKNVQNNSISTEKIQANAVTIDKIASPIVSSINNVSNDGGNINLVAGNNISLVPDNTNKTITISAAGGGTGTGSISSLTEGNGIVITNPAGPFPAIGIKPNLLLGPSGSLGILNQNSASVISLSSISQGGFLSLSNGDLINTFGVIGSNLDKHPLLYLNNRLGNQVAELKADEFSSGMLTLKSVLNNPLVQLKANENTGGLINVFNSNGLITTQLTTSTAGNGIKAGNGKLVLNSVDNNRVLQLETNTAGGGVLRLYNIEGNEAVRLTTFNTFGGSVSVNNRAGINVGELHTTNEGNGRLSLFSANDKPTVSLTTNTTNGGGLFTLRNADGNEAIKASTFLSRQPYFLMLNTLSNPAVEIKANEFSDGELTLNSVLQNPTVRLTANDNAGGLVNVFNPNGDVAIRLTASPTGFLGIFNRDKTEMIQLGIKSDQNARITVNNRLGNSVADLESNDFSDGSLQLYSVLKNPTLQLKANDNGGGLINLFSQEGGVPKIAASLTEEDGGKFSIFNTDASEIIQLSALPNRNARIRVNNRLGNPVADLISNEFSDGELSLSSSSKNPTVKITANDDAGGLINVFNKSTLIAAKISETNGFGNMKIYNPEGRGIVEMSEFNRAGRMVIYNPAKEVTERGVASVYVDTASGYGVFGVASKIFSGLAELTGDTKENGFLGLYHSNTGSRVPIVSVGGSADAEGYMHLFNSSSKAMISLYSSAGDGTIALSNKLGKRGASLDGSQFGGTLSLHNAASSLVHLMTTNQVNQEGIYSVRSKTDQEKKRLELGGDNVGNGYLNLFNNKGLNTFFIGHNEFADASIELKNNLGNLGGYFTAFRDGGSIAVTDGKPGTNHRATMGSNLFGGRTTLFNSNNLMTHESSVQQNGEGILRIVNPNEITKSRVEIGGTSAKNGFISTFDATNKRNIDLQANAEGAGIITTYKNDKVQTTLNATTAGGDLQIFNTAGFNTSQVGHFDDGRGKIEVGHSNGTKVARMTSNSDGSGYIGVDNTDKNEVVRLTANTGKGGGIGVKNNLNKDIITMTQSNRSDGSILVYNANGNNTSAIAHFDDGRGKIEVGTADGNKVARMTANSDGSGFITVDNVDKLDVVRITANTGKGGGIGIRNNLAKDIIQLTQDNSSGIILVNNAAGGLLATITHNSGNGGVLSTKDGKGGDAVILSTNDKGGGNISTYNDLGKVTSLIALNDNNQGKISVNGSAGNEIAQLTGSTDGTGLLNIFNSTGVNLAGLKGNSTSGGGNLFAKNSTGKEVARMTTGTNGTGIISIDNTTGINLAGMVNNITTGGGIVYANNSTGKEVARLTTVSNGSGIVSIDNTSGTNLAGLKNNTTTGGGTVYANNSSGTEVARITSDSTSSGTVTIDNSVGVRLAGIAKNSANGGLVFANNSTGKQVIRMATSGTGAGYLQMDNSAGSTILSLVPTINNTGYISVANATGGERARLLVNTNGGGYIGATNSAGSEVSIVKTTDDGEGYIGTTNNAGSPRAYMIGGDFGGSVILKDKNNNIRLTTNVLGMQADAVDGSRMTLGTDGLVFYDKSHFARAQINTSNIFASSPTGNVISLMGGISPTLGYIAVYNSSVPGNVPKAGMYVDTDSKKGIIFGDMKNFRMDYPGKPDKEIWYGSLEGPELSAYIRGTGKLLNGKASIEFPDHYVQVANAQTMTVILTPLSGKSKGLAVVNKKTTGFEVEELMEGSGAYEFDWEVKCVRKGYENYEPVRNKSDEPKPFIETTGTPTNMITGSERANHTSKVKEVISPMVNTKNQ